MKPAHAWAIGLVCGILLAALIQNQKQKPETALEHALAVELPNAMIPTATDFDARLTEFKSTNCTRFFYIAYKGDPFPGEFGPNLDALEADAYSYVMASNMWDVTVTFSPGAPDSLANLPRFLRPAHP